MTIHHPNALRVTPGTAVSGGSIGGRPENRRLPDLPAKCTVHSTETGPGSGGAVAARAKWPYTLIADPVERELLELMPLDWTALALRGTHADTDAKIECNHAGEYHVQVALVGYARRMRDLPADQLDWLADVVFAPIIELCGVANHWAPTFDEEDGMILASASSPIRLDLAGCQLWPGFLHHQTWYGNDHWDPGALNVDYLAARLANTTPTTPGVPMSDDISPPSPREAVEIVYQQHLQRVPDWDATAGDRGPHWWAYRLAAGAESFASLDAAVLNSPEAQSNLAALDGAAAPVAPSPAVPAAAAPVSAPADPAAEVVAKVVADLRAAADALEAVETVRGA